MAKPYRKSARITSCRKPSVECIHFNTPYNSVSRPTARPNPSTPGTTCRILAKSAASTQHAAHSAQSAVTANPIIQARIPAF